MIPSLCIYHGNCADGFGAAWAVHKAYGPVVAFHPGVYGEAPPDVTGHDVLLVDFSYKRDVLVSMGTAANSITILDHHKTAQADLADFIVPDAMMLEPVEAFVSACHFAGKPAIRARFDMEKSGAALAWEWAHPGVPLPRLIAHIQDRDLWRFGMAHTREIQATLFSYPYDFEVWDGLADLADNDVHMLIAEGEAIERKHFKDIDELLSVTMRYMVIGGHRVPVANLPYTMSSDAAGKLAEGNAFGACYIDTPRGRVFSLRSRGGIDVSEVAKRYGGGGHAAAAGFTAPAGWEGEALAQPAAEAGF